MTVVSSAPSSTRRTRRAKSGRTLAYRSKANLALLERRGLSAELQRPKPRGRPMPTHIRRANAARATIRSAVEHVVAAQKRRTGLVIRTIGIARARAKLALANITYNLSRLAWLERQSAPA